MEKQIKKLILTRGIPGSGKSTWAKAWVAEDPEHRIRLNWDDMRNMMGPYWVPSREPINKHMLWAGLNMAAYCTRPYDIVIDNMNLNPKDWKQYEEWITTYNQSMNSDETNTQYVIEFKDFFIALDECIRRDAMRPNPIGEKTIKDIWRRYKHFIQTTEVENVVNNLRPSTGKVPCIVVDMDSTMCFNTNKRPWYGEGAAEGMIKDVPNPGVVAVVKELQRKFPIVVVTGRDMTQATVTKQWLANQGIAPTDFYFRTAGDYRKGVEVKNELINQVLNKYDIVAIFEDCEPIVKMFREMGLTVLQPNKGL
jgi:predicted kinase